MRKDRIYKTVLGLCFHMYVKFGLQISFKTTWGYGKERYCIEFMGGRRLKRAGKGEQVKKYMKCSTNQ